MFFAVVVAAVSFTEMAIAALHLGFYKFQSDFSANSALFYLEEKLPLLLYKVLQNDSWEK